MASTSIPEPPAQRRRDWLDLPHELTATILRRLGAIEILENAHKVCTTWRNVCKDPAMWSTVDMRNAGDLGYASADLVKMAMHAVDRSCGQLVDINIEHFGGDDLLKHIGNR
ncbi:hypothetical protein RJ639_027403 [Escallonia herrerae]|uniref:F-box domain-containing protein n=1 Tax=Escallonia herrerae TaxID=1293975 RepID=A0AA88X571_9ASTE|nr:hypothetical protein RJ639_027403 [Escallonia herrerae]